MSLIPSLFDEASARYNRFKRLFQAQNTLNDLVNEILGRHGDKLKVRKGNEHDLSLIIASALGKGMKSSQAITRLCLLGFGEDALVLLRSNINLLINIAYIVSSESPVECGKDFLDFSYEERVKYLKTAHNVQEVPWKPKASPDEIARRAKSWREPGIAGRAKAIPPFHYGHGYRLYSSLEHSDAFALNDYIGHWNEVGPFIESGPTDKYVDLALVHSFGVIADLLIVVCKYFEIDRPDIFKRLQNIWAELGSWDQPSSSSII